MPRNLKTLGLLISLMISVMCTACANADSRTPLDANTTSAPITGTRTSQPSSPIQTSPINSPTAAQTVQSTVLSTPTPWKVTVIDPSINPTPPACQKEPKESTSTNGRWSAVTCEDQDVRTLQILENGEVRYILSVSDYLAESDQDFALNSSLYPVFWAVDDNDLYFDSFENFDQGGACYQGHGPEGFFRLDLVMGLVEPILPLLSYPRSYWIAVSPDGQYLAYATDRLSILDLSTGNVTTIESAGNAEAFSLQWSPDGSQLAYILCSLEDDIWTIKVSEARLYTPAEGSSTTILNLESAEMWLKPRENPRYLEIRYRLEHSSVAAFVVWDWQLNRILEP